MADEERETDDERVRVAGAQQIAQSARADAITPVYRPEPAVPAPTPGMSAWRINWPGVAMPGAGGSPFTWAPPPPAAPPEPVAAAPFGKADRRDQPFVFPPPDLAENVDQREIISVPVRTPSVVAAARRDLPELGGTSPFAPGAVAALTSGGPPPPPAAAPAAATTGDIAGPEAVAARFKQVQALNAEQIQLERDRQAALEPARKAREQYLANTRRELAEYQEGLKAARPPQPKLEKMPAVPDMKIRPWLDPEGKNAISVIAQTLGMLAVGAAGAYYKAPLTAMKYFREAAENWRRDEVDAAASKFKQFQATVETIKNDNDVELKQYELADKAYAHNIEAKKAMVAAQLDNLGLQDQAIKALEQPYDERVKAVQVQAKNILDIQKASTDYLEVVAKLNKGAAKLPATELGLGGFIAEGRRRLADPADPVATDPVARKTLEGQVQSAQDSLKDYRQNKIAGAEEKAQNAATITIGRTRLQEGLKLSRQADYLERQLEKLALDYKTAATVPGALPASNTLVDQWWSQIQTHVTRFPPEVQGALQSIKTFKNEMQVPIARTFLDDRGVQSIKAFGDLQNSVMPLPAAIALIRRWNSMIKDARRDANRLITEGGRILETPGASAVPTRAPQSEPESEPE